MSDIAKTFITGRLTRDSELKYTAGGQAIARFSVASNYRKKNGDEWVDQASFFDIVLWGRAAETLNQYLQKGKQVTISGELRQERWEQDGLARSKVVIHAQEVQLHGGAQEPRQGPQSAGNRESHNTPAKTAGRPREMPDTASDDGFIDDIPF